MEYSIVLDDMKPRMTVFAPHVRHHVAIIELEL